jgi:mono/diheme cytochrome c family protein
MTILQLRKMAAIFFAMMLFSVLGFSVGAQGTDPSPSDAGAYYKAKCAMCHGQRAEKKFDATMAEAEMVGVILKGKKAEKPPNMPGYAAKGVTEDQAKSIATFMKQLKDAAPTN